MSDAAVIAGALVDMKNVSTHKCMRLIIDVPAENALKVIAAFGWPTMVNPVSVAVARLVPEVANRKDGEATEHPGSSSENTRSVTTPRPSVVPASAAGADIPPELDRRRKSPAQIAGYLCTTIPFQKFLQEQQPQAWHAAAGIVSSRTMPALPSDIAAIATRVLCNVNSRADLTDKNIEWNALLLAFRLWENHPELEDA